MNNCIIHNEPITHFCQNCADIICDQCLRDSHSDKLHTIQSLENAYNKRVTSIQTYLNTEIKTKRNNLLEQIAKTNYKIAEIEKTSKIIQNDVQVEVEGLIMRLDNAEAQKVVKFQSQIKRLEHLVNIVDDIFYTFQQSVKVPEKFLLLYKQIKERTINVDVYKIASPLAGDHTELPEQFKTMEEQIEEAQKIEQQSEFINDVLVRILESYKNVLRAKELAVRQRQSDIIKQYFSINQKLIAHHFSLSKTCYFCGHYLSLTTINTACSHNRPFKLGQARSSTFIEAPNQIRGTRRHHWVANQKQLKQNKQIQNNKLHLILITMRKNLYQKSITISQLFKSEDKSKSGTVNKLVFSYILSNKLGLEDEQLNTLIKNFEQSDGNVSYSKLNDLIKDKQYLDEPVSATSHQKVKQTPVTQTKKRYAY